MGGKFSVDSSPRRPGENTLVVATDYAGDIEVARAIRDAVRRSRLQHRRRSRRRGTTSKGWLTSRRCDSDVKGDAGRRRRRGRPGAHPRRRSPERDEAFDARRAARPATDDEIRAAFGASALPARSFEGEILADAARDGEYVAGANRDGWHLRGVAASDLGRGCRFREPREGTTALSAARSASRPRSRGVTSSTSVRSTGAVAGSVRRRRREKPPSAAAVDRPGRVMAAIVEQRHDTRESTVRDRAPYDVHLAVLKGAEMIASRRRPLDEADRRPPRRPRPSPWRGSPTPT